MNLLMITRKVDRQDSRAGHTYAWVKAIAEKLDGKLFVICLEKGDVSDLPSNVVVDSLGKERGTLRMLRWFKFPFLFWRRVGGVSAVFCHQNPEYTFGAWLCGTRLMGKKIVAWYTHGKLTARARMVSRIAHVVLTASRESFPVKTSRASVKPVGHGIDTEQFQTNGRVRWLDPKQLRIVSVGRISPTKDYETLIQAVAGLCGEQPLRTSDGKPIVVTLAIVGAPALPSDENYFTTLKELVNRQRLNDRIKFVGPVPHSEIAAWYQPDIADLMVNLSGTASIDKAVLEAMACGCPVITSNLAFRGIVPDECVVPSNDPPKLAQAITNFFEKYRYSGANYEMQVSRPLRQVVERFHSLDQLANEIVAACAV